MFIFRFTPCWISYTCSFSYWCKIFVSYFFNHYLAVHGTPSDDTNGCSANAMYIWVDELALSKLDECEIGPEEFSKLAELNSKIGIITGTNDIVGSLALASENVLTQYLKENC